MIEIIKMNRVMDIFGKETGKVNLTLYADSISELSGVTAQTFNFPEGISIQPGSVAYDADAKVATYKSNGTWNTV